MLLLEVRNENQEGNKSLKDSKDFNEELRPAVPQVYHLVCVYLIEDNEHEVDEHDQGE